MRALVLCAGAGTRLRPLTQIMPKPLVEVGGVPMAVRQIRALARAGVDGFVVNAATGAARLMGVLGDEARWGQRVHFSVEGQTAAEALETRGGIVRALPVLTQACDAFIVAAGDIVTDYDYAKLVAVGRTLSAEGTLAHLALVDNPVYHPSGDFALAPDGRIVLEGEKLTFAAFGVYHKALFEGVKDGRAALFPWLLDFIRVGRVTGEHYRGRWANVGSLEELERAERLFGNSTDGKER